MASLIGLFALPGCAAYVAGGTITGVVAQHVVGNVLAQVVLGMGSNGSENSQPQNTLHESANVERTWQETAAKVIGCTLVIGCMAAGAIGGYGLGAHYAGAHAAEILSLVGTGRRPIIQIPPTLWQDFFNNQLFSIIGTFVGFLANSWGGRSARAL